MRVFLCPSEMERGVSADGKAWQLPPLDDNYLLQGLQGFPLGKTIGWTKASLCKAYLCTPGKSTLHLVFLSLAKPESLAGCSEAFVYSVLSAPLSLLRVKTLPHKL